jgi:tetratricopeptide (TPR) repeat protein
MEQLLEQAERSLLSGDIAAAERLCADVLARERANPDALRLLGLARLRSGRATEAIPPLREALRGNDRDLGILDALSAALTAAGSHAQAEEVVRRALALDQEQILWRMRLGMALASQGKWREAVDVYEDVLARDPRIADAHHNLGDALTKVHRLPEAMTALRRALALNPGNPDTHNSLGVVLQEVGLWEAALAHYQAALAALPGDVPATYNLGLLRLFRHEFVEGWKDYEFRLRDPIRRQERLDMRTLDLFEGLPRWNGPQEPGVREVAVWAEQGIGDQLVYSTLIPELIAAGMPILYEVDRRMLDAYARAFPAVRFFPLADPPAGELQKAHRVQLAGSLPGLFRTSRKSFARQPVSVLAADPVRVERYRRELAARAPALKVALSWRSTRSEWHITRKSAALDDFAPLFRLAGACFIDVQYGDTAAERSRLRARHGVELVRFDEVDYFNDLEDVLAIIESCDLVVTTSNATAHLAGALGKTAWLLYLADRSPFHYWTHGGTLRSLWYPSVEVVTAKYLTGWPALLEEVADRLAQLTGKPAVRVAENRAEAAPETLARRAAALRAEGRLDEAREAANRALTLSPECAPAWFNLGAVQTSQGETGLGIASYRKAVELEPGFARAWSNLGATLGEGGDKTGELEAYLHAAYAGPDLAPVWSNLGTAFMEAGELAEAASACRRAVEADPHFAPGWNNLANALQRQGELEDAVAACERALTLAPALAEAWGTLGSILHGLRRYDEADEAHRRALAAKPQDPQLHYNLGLTLLHCGRIDDAVERFRQALAIDPGHVAAHWDLSFALLALGRWAEGWNEYDWRWRRADAEPARYGFASWHGDRAAPARLLVWGEQGVGDQILHASMIPDLLASPLRLTVEVDSRLVPLFARSFPGARVIPAFDPPAADPADHDHQSALGSLGRFLRRSWESFPRHPGYLRADTSRVRSYRDRLLKESGKGARVVGISWQSTNREVGMLKSIPLDEWAPVLRVPSASFVDLQYGDTTAERALAAGPSAARIHHLLDLDLQRDLDGVAALCAACDLVITVSNVTAHIAGGLGVPTWLVLPQANGRFWYWPAGRSETPWYPSVRIFTRRAAGGWRETMEAVAAALAALIDGQCDHG